MGMIQGVLLWAILIIAGAGVKQSVGGTIGDIFLWVGAGIGFICCMASVLASMHSDRNKD